MNTVIIVSTVVLIAMAVGIFVTVAFEGFPRRLAELIKLNRDNQKRVLWAALAVMASLMAYPVWIVFAER